MFLVILFFFFLEKARSFYVHKKQKISKHILQTISKVCTVLKLQEERFSSFFNFRFFLKKIDP